MNSRGLVLGTVAIALAGVLAIAARPGHAQGRIESESSARPAALGSTSAHDPVPDRPNAGWLRSVLAPERDEAALEAGHANALAWVESERSAEAWYWVATLAALRAETAGARSKIGLGKEAFLAADSALALDDTNAGAHHVMGRLHAGVLRLGRVTRWIGRQLGLGDLMDQASWESAEFHMRRAHELAPRELSYALEYASLLVSLGRAEEAVRLFESIRNATAADAWDLAIRTRACSEWLDVGSVEACDAPG